MSKRYFFFVSDRAGGHGGLDLWLSVVDKKGNYGNPINLGNKINTSSDEITPFYNQAENKLYFSSNKPLGKGGFDIYRSEGILNIWKEVENVSELNTSKDENYLNFYTKRRGYFCSNREPACFDTEDFCCTDVFSFEYLDEQDNTDSIEQKIMSELPLNLYFHNDEPDCCTMDTVTNQTYTQAYISYFKLQNKYIQENKEEDIITFFEDSLKGNFNKLEQVLKLLEGILSNGEKIEIQIRGFTSPLHSTEYNVNLSKRRINSFMNFLDKFESGKILQYFSNNQLTITFLPFGESESSDSVSDNRDDKRQSIYSLPAMYSRKIQLVNVNFQK